MKQRHLVLLILPLLFAGCVEPRPAPPLAAARAEVAEPDGIIATTNYPAIMTEAYAQVTVADGVSIEEAPVLADAYFSGYITGCGMIGEVSDHGEKWHVETFIDYSHSPYDPIRINKKTGRIMCGQGPVVDPPL
jgi:hypothetical protein